MIYQVPSYSMNSYPTDPGSPNKDLFSVSMSNRSGIESEQAMQI